MKKEIIFQEFRPKSNTRTFESNVFHFMTSHHIPKLMLNICFITSEFNWPLALLTLGTGQNGTSPRTTSRRHSSTSETKKELRLARISVCIVWLFLFCHVWKLVPTIYSTFIEVRTHHMFSKNPEFSIYNCFFEKQVFFFDQNNSHIGHF